MENKENTPANNQNANQKNNSWIPWVLGILLAVALTALLFTVLKSEKPVVTYTDENGIIVGTVKSPSVDVRFQTDQPKQLKENYETRLQEEKQRTENAEVHLEKVRRANASTTNTLVKKVDEVVVELKGVRSDLQEVKEWQEVINDNINTGFGNVNKNLSSIDKNVVSVKEEVKKQHELTREEMKNVFKSIPRSLKNNADEDNDWPSGAKK